MPQHMRGFKTDMDTDIAIADISMPRLSTALQETRKTNKFKIIRTALDSGKVLGVASNVTGPAFLQCFDCSK